MIIVTLLQLRPVPALAQLPWPWDGDPFGMFGQFFGFFMIIFAIFSVFIVIMIIFSGYRACRASQNRRLDQIAATSTYDVTRLPRPTRKILREVLPRECDECGAPLKYNNVKWTGPRQAECPYCGHTVELELVETTIEE